MQGILSPIGKINGNISGEELYGRLDIANIGASYTGDYELTPTSETQIIQTADKILSQDITINPIPSNYGLITWNGTALTVS